MSKEQSGPVDEPMTAVPTDSAILALEEKIDRLESEKQELQKQMLRTVADAQNILRRTREQYVESSKFASQSLVEALLPVVTNFERTLASLDSGASAEKILEGIGAIDRQIKQVLAAHAVTRISAVGEHFDPAKHEAIATVESEDHAEGTVVAEIEPGYMMHDRVIRPARVQVTKKP